MNYSMLRLFLTERDIPPILEASGDAPSHSRLEYLVEVFGKDISFLGNRGVPYSYVYIGQVDSFILGRVGRMKTEVHSDGPETGFADTEAKFWHASNFILDTSGDNDGQKIGLECISDVGNPLSIAQSLAAHINHDFEARWHIDANPITKTIDFWKAVEANKGNITELDLTFIAPNIFGSKDKVSAALKGLNEESNVQKTEVKLTNPDHALNPDSERIRESINYISEGGGSVKLKSGKETIYNSDETEVSEKVEGELDISLAKENNEKWRDLIKRIFKR